MDFTPLFSYGQGVPTIFHVRPSVSLSEPVPFNHSIVLAFLRHDNCGVCGHSHVVFLHVKQRNKPPISPTWYTPSLQLKSHTSQAEIVRHCSKPLEAHTHIRLSGEPTMASPSSYEYPIYTFVISSLVLNVEIGSLLQPDVYGSKVLFPWSWVHLFGSYICNCSGFVCCFHSLLIYFAVQSNNVK